MAKDPKHYVDNAKLHEAMTEYYNGYQEHLKTGVDKPVISNYIGECLYLIASGLSLKPRFRGYSFREEMISDGIENCIQYALHNYNPYKTKNPFSYFTTIIKYAFLRRIEEEKKQQYLKHKNYQKIMHSLELTGESVPAPNDPYDVVESYEKLREEKAKKKLEKKKQNE